MAAATAQSTPTPSSGGGLAQGAFGGANAGFSSGVMYMVHQVIPDKKTVQQEYGELITGIRSGDLETGVRAVLKYARGQTANIATMGVFAGLAYKKGGLAALGSFGSLLSGGLIGGFAGAYVGNWGGDWFAKNVLHWDKVDIDSDKPVCKGDVICHQRKNLGLWGIVGGVILGALVAYVGIVTFGAGFFVAGLAAGFVGGAIMAAGNAMSQYGEVKGEILEGSPNVTFEDRPVARMGDKVKCDDHSHEEFIAEGVKTVTVNDRLLAKVGCRTTCDGNLDRESETTIGVDKETATDPENYPIRESTSLLAEFAATAAIYIPWDKVFGKVREAFRGGGQQRVNSPHIDELLSQSGASADELANYLRNIDPSLADDFIQSGKWPENVQIPKDSGVLTPDGEIDWEQAPSGGYELDGAGRPVRSPHTLEVGDILDRYGSSDGRYTSPIDDGVAFSYDERSLPYVEDNAMYHRYEVTGDLSEIKSRVDAITDASLRQKIHDYIDTYYPSNQNLTAYRGQAAPAFGAQGGATQIELPMRVEWLEKLGILKELP